MKFLNIDSNVILRESRAVFYKKDLAILLLILKCAQPLNTPCYNNFCSF